MHVVIRTIICDTCLEVVEIQRSNGGEVMAEHYTGLDDRTYCEHCVRDLELSERYALDLLDFDLDA